MSEETTADGGEAHKIERISVISLPHVQDEPSVDNSTPPQDTKTVETEGEDKTKEVESKPKKAKTSKFWRTCKSVGMWFGRTCVSIGKWAIAIIVIILIGMAIKPFADKATNTATASSSSMWDTVKGWVPHWSWSFGSPPAPVEKVWQMSWVKTGDVVGVQPEVPQACFKIKFKRQDDEMLWFDVYGYGDYNNKVIATDILKKPTVQSEWQWVGEYKNPVLNNSGQIKLKKIGNKYFGIQSTDERCTEWADTVIEEK